MAGFGVGVLVALTVGIITGWATADARRRWFRASRSVNRAMRATRAALPAIALVVLAILTAVVALWFAAFQPLS